MLLLCNPPLSHPFVNAMPLLLQTPLAEASFTHASTRGWISASLMKRWAEKRATGEAPQEEQMGSISSRGSYVCEHVSH